MKKSQYEKVIQNDVTLNVRIQIITSIYSLTPPRMTNLQDLLNKLISLWRKPYWLNFKKIEEVCWLFYLHPNFTPYSLNDLCSIDSWLRQFVCEKGLYNHDLYGNIGVKYPSKNINDTWLEHDTFNNTYRIMLSSIQENKEKFLLSSIVIND